jgi:hypothetical protein
VKYPGDCALIAVPKKSLTEEAPVDGAPGAGVKQLALKVKNDPPALMIPF